MPRRRLAEPAGNDRAASSPVKGGLRPSLRDAGAPLTACGGHPVAPPRSARQHLPVHRELELHQILNRPPGWFMRLGSCPPGNGPPAP
jgi:hypothetical protein